jgi:hypothetical protein
LAVAVGGVGAAAVGEVVAGGGGVALATGGGGEAGGMTGGGGTMGRAELQWQLQPFAQVNVRTFTTPAE